MRVLGIETSTLQGGVAIVDDRRVVCENSLSVEMTHSERLLPTIDRALTDAGMTLADLGGIAVSLGPGSFTGLRIALSTAKGLAYATGLPVVGVPTLEVMASGLPAAQWPICPVLDARKHEVYAALFCHQAHSLVRLQEDCALTPERLCDWIDGPTLFVGDGVDVYGDLWRARLGDRILLAPVFVRAARPAVVAELGRSRLVRGDYDNPEALIPRYLRPSEAELRRRAVEVGTPSPGQAAKP